MATQGDVAVFFMGLYQNSVKYHVKSEFAFLFITGKWLFFGIAGNDGADLGTAFENTKDHDFSCCTSTAFSLAFSGDE